MQTKIFWLIDNIIERFGANQADQDLVFSGMLEVAQRVAQPTTEFVLNPMSHNMGRYEIATYKYDRAMMAVEVLERMKQAEADGFDAGFPGMCYGEFFLQEARQAVSMPVAGPAESSMTVAQMLGSKFGVITVAPEYIVPMEQAIRLQGRQDRAIANRPVRYWQPDFFRLTLDAFNGKPEEMIEEFEKEALKVIEEGADVIIFGCNPMSAALAWNGYHEVTGTGVPVVAPLPAMVKMAESLVDLRRSAGYSKTEAVMSPYRSTPDRTLQDMAERGIGLPELRQAGQTLAQAYVPDKGRAAIAGAEVPGTEIPEA